MLGYVPDLVPVSAELLWVFQICIRSKCRKQEKRVA
jgi:hypothetical protein